MLAKSCANQGIGGRRLFPTSEAGQKATPCLASKNFLHATNSSPIEPQRVVAFRTVLLNRILRQHASKASSNNMAHAQHSHHHIPTTLRANNWAHPPTTSLREPTATTRQLQRCRGSRLIPYRALLQGHSVSSWSSSRSPRHSRPARANRDDLISKHLKFINSVLVQGNLLHSTIFTSRIRESAQQF